MGSAVTKPLTRRRGKVKTNELADNSIQWNLEENVNDNCQPNADCLENSLRFNVNSLHNPLNGNLAASTSHETSSCNMATSPMQDTTAITPRSSTTDRTGGQKSSMSSLAVKASKGLSVLNSCLFSGGCPMPYQKAKLSQRWPSENSVCSRRGEQSKKILETPKERSSTSQACSSPRKDISRNASDIFVKETENVSSVDSSSIAALAARAKCLSPDQIGNIRKQLYTEVLNPAEREGGVAFFIPVKEDGIQPQTDWTVVAERITKKKKASLNFEERMILANINRQAQLSKRKEFAVRDIRNVKGAVSTTDITDRTKQDDDAITDYDGAAMSRDGIDIELDASCSKKASIESEFDSADLNKKYFDAEYDMFLMGEES